MPLVLSGTNGVLDNSGAFVAGTAVASTSGTSITFTSIPSWVKRVTVMFNGVSTSGGSDFLIRIGSGSIATSGYVSYAVYTGIGTSGGGSTAGFRTIATSAGQSWYGFSTIVLQNSSTNSYCSNGLNSDGSQYMAISSGSISLAGVMDRVQVTTANGTDTFDAGSINILYE
jgi:hypothetical protein